MSAFESWPLYARERYCKDGDVCASSTARVQVANVSKYKKKRHRLKQVCIKMCSGGCVQCTVWH